ncbi:transglycosylase SLT domain-containing protein [Haloimpatiens sp. FM7330]|uniref:transglycosylase SLT domain-containing protein n=1 Tax=Haloimpatiens sp. FM7330 TaxID=3298610 RepID=UPI00362B1825
MKKIGIVLASLLIVFFAAAMVARSLVYPLKYKAEIQKYAKEYSVEPELIAAIINVSSNFDPKPYKKGERCGLMDLQDKSAMILAKQMGFKDFKSENLGNPDTNIKIGTWFISQNYKNKDIEEVVTKWGGVNYADAAGDLNLEKEKKKWEDYFKKYYVEKIKKRMKVYKILYPTL